MKGFVAAVVVIGVFCIFQVSANKMCYSCEDCDDVKDDTPRCNTTTYCLTVTMKAGSDNSTVARSCGDSTCKKAECTTVGDVETCCCDTDSCNDASNGASALNSALVVVMAPLVASVYFTLS